MQRVGSLFFATLVFCHLVTPIVCPGIHPDAFRVTKEFLISYFLREPLGELMSAVEGFIANNLGVPWQQADLKINKAICYCLEAILSISKHQPSNLWIHFYMERINKIIQTTEHVCPESEKAEITKLTEEFKTRLSAEQNGVPYESGIVGLQKSAEGFEEVHVAAQYPIPDTKQYAIDTKPSPNVQNPPY